MIKFKYQNYWCRVIFLLPLIVILPSIEIVVLESLGMDLKTVQFYMLSTIITFAVAFGLYKYTGALFTRQGTIEIDEEKICIYKGNKEECLKVESILKVECVERHLYGISFALFIVTHKINEKEKMYYICSEDFEREKLKECSLWKIYQEVNKICNSYGIRKVQNING